MDIIYPYCDKFHYYYLILILEKIRLFSVEFTRISCVSFCRYSLPRLSILICVGKKIPAHFLSYQIAQTQVEGVCIKNLTEVISALILRATTQGSRKLFTLSPSLPIPKTLGNDSYLLTSMRSIGSVSRCSQAHYSIISRKDEGSCHCRVAPQSGKLPLEVVIILCT